MPLIETKGAASAQGFGGAGAGASGPVTYIEDVFSTYLYTGNGSTQTITNGIDLAGKGGATWIKVRDLAGEEPTLFNTATQYGIGTNTTGFNTRDKSLFWTVTSSGFTIPSSSGGNPVINQSNKNYASWTFRKQPKFFDVVTYTGTGSARTIAHSLGSAPGCIIIKKTSSTGNWATWHRSGTQINTYVAFLNSIGKYQDQGNDYWGSLTMSSTVFSVGTTTDVNASGETYVAYLFAHNAGGFGLSGTDNVISCGSYTGNGSATGPTITLGYEPQWLMIKNASGTGNWNMIDNMRGMPVGSADAFLEANTSDAEATADWVSPTATGFNIVSTSSEVNTNTSTYIYIAIRRGPMKVPTSGTSVFSTTTNQPASSGLWGATNLVDFALAKWTSGSQYWSAYDRLRGYSPYLQTNSTSAEISYGDSQAFARNADWYTAGLFGANIYSGYFISRAPGFFDVVCYTGTGAAAFRNHNLGAAPELMIVKGRNFGGWDWAVYAGDPNQYLRLNTVNQSVAAADTWNYTTPTSTQFGTGTSPLVGANGWTYVAYLFATAPGVSKVGSYTGTGALQTVNCGFTGGARFVLIKRTDSTGDWYVYDSARGISSGNDPYLLLNSTAAEVTGTNYVDTTSVGFQVTAAAPAGLNANGGTYIFLAIA